MSARLIFRGATVHTGLEGPSAIIPRGQVVVDHGRIVSVGPEGPVSGGELIDCTGQHLCPGFIDAHTHIGNLPEGFVGESKDFNEMTHPVTPQMRALDAIWPGDVAFAKARAHGVTTVCTLPGSANVVGGTGVVLKTVGNDVEQMALRPHDHLKVAFGHTVKHSHGIKAGRMPLTRMGIAHLFRDAFERAERYEQARLLSPEATPRDRGLEVLVQALNREIPLRAHAYRADDILTALRLAKEFGLDLILEHAYEAPKVLDQVVAAGAGIVYGPSFRTCGSSEQLDFGFEHVKTLIDAGLRVAVMTDHPIVPVQYLPLQAGLCVRHGLEPEQALRCITATAADLLGVADRVGRLRAGLDADLVRLDGPPLSVETRTTGVWIDGVPVG